MNNPLAYLANNKIGINNFKKLYEKVLDHDSKIKAIERNLSGVYNDINRVEGFYNRSKRKKHKREKRKIFI
jgi:hypothetical protein